MPPRDQSPPPCQVCTEHQSKYTCPQCQLVYCSLGCYKKHKGSTCITPALKPTPEEPRTSDAGDASTSTSTSASASSAGPSVPPKTVILPSYEDPLADSSTPQRPLTSLNWPYVPDESAFPDPLKRDDPKTLQLHQYEAIATSSAIRKILAEYKSLPGLLQSIDKLRGPEREEALQRALGVTAPEIDDQLRRPDLDEDIIALRQLAEAIEGAVNGGNESALGLNWGEEP